MARPVSARGEGRARVIAAALDLFADHGVSGTSLQMIADHLGVTKAAVYYQFKAKEDIVSAVLEPVFDGMRRIVTAAGRVTDPVQAATIALEGIVDLVIEQRRVMASLYRDPEIERIVGANAEFAAMTEQLGGHLRGPAPDVHRRVVVAVLGAGLAHAGMDADLSDVDDATLRHELTSLGRAMLLTTA